MTDEKQNECKFCGGIDREPTAGEKFIGALMTTTQNITIDQLAEIAARLGLKIRLVITEMSEDERKNHDEVGAESGESHSGTNIWDDAAEKLAVKP